MKLTYQYEVTLTWWTPHRETVVVEGENVSDAIAQARGNLQAREDARIDIVVNDAKRS